MKGLALAALAAGTLAGLPAGAGLPWPLHLPAAVERWLYNPRERTTKAMAAYAAGDSRRAMALADTALRLAPGDPRVQYSAGTARLAAGDEREAAKRLGQAAADAPPDLAAAAWYNLGNAHLAGHDPAEAVEAYRKSLLAEPGDADAKFNLELALRELEKQRGGGKGAPQPNGKSQEQQNKQGQQGDDQQQGQQDAGKQGDGRPGQNPSQPQGQGQRQSQGAEGEAGRQGPGGLRFKNQPDMNAAEATALLQSVENLERQQRRAQAARRARSKAAGEKDW